MPGSILGGGVRNSAHVYLEHQILTIKPLINFPIHTIPPNKLKRLINVIFDIFLDICSFALPYVMTAVKLVNNTFFKADIPFIRPSTGWI